MKNVFKVNKGVMLVAVLVFASISAVLLASLIGWSGINMTASRESAAREQAFQIAEAGIEYYRWHFSILAGESCVVRPSRR
jgi:type II secretory pathway pseudopilin PulG